MSSRVAFFNSQKEAPQQDSEKLLDLYWNRAELKKAYAEAREEQHRLQKRIDEQKGTQARIEQKLEHLESLLIDPEWVHSVAVHYQLRALNNRCKARLSNFAEQLKQQREKRQHAKLLETWNEQRSGAAHSVQRQVGELRVKIQKLEEEALEERTQFEESNVILRLFRRGKLRERLEALEDTLVTVHAKEAELLQKLRQLKESTPPDQQGLDLAAKRSINFMIIAFAQQLFLLFNDDRLATLVKESMDKSVGGIQYGSKEDCNGLLADIEKRWDAFESVMDYADVLQQRARLLSEKSLFMKDTDAVPVAATVSTIIAFGEGGTVSTRDGNLLGENYWDLSKVLSR